MLRGRLVNAPLVLAWCDDLFLQGHQLAAWVTDYVDLEESLTMGSIAQDLLAHAAALMGTCGVSAEERDWRIYERPAEEWFPSRVSLAPDGDWAAAVARGFVLNRATLVFRRYADLPDRPRVRELAQLIWAEQDLHARHWERWVRILASRPELSVGFRAALDQALNDAADLFGVPRGVDHPDEILTGASPLEMHTQWVQDSARSLAACGVPESCLPAAPSARKPGHTSEALLDILTEVRSWRRERAVSGDRAGA
jgi:ring-1,2-phenylacetyl-CoA epoxidase subunit PaaC